jgi:hypothetical protein
MAWNVPFHRDDGHVILDTAHYGRHQMMVLRVDWAAVGAA